jgi:hypothetical protein
VEGGADRFGAGGLVHFAEAEAKDLDRLDAGELLGGLFGEEGGQLFGLLDVGRWAPRVVDEPLGGITIEEGEGGEQDDALDAAAKKLGAPSGPKASIEFRKMIGSHTDTYANGPMTAAQILAEIAK